MLLLWRRVDLFIPVILPNLNPICHLLALGAHHILHVGRIRVKAFSQNGLRLGGLVGHAVAQWLRHYATICKVVGSIPDGVTGIFH